jgi:hypothetical protein
MNNTNREPYLDISIGAFNQANNILGSLIEQRSHFTEKDKQLIQTLATCCNTGEAISKLLESDTTLSEGYMLMRVLLEKLVNYHYLRCSNDSELKRFQEYPYYRYYHSLRHRVSGHTMKLVIDNPKAKMKKLQAVPPFNEALKTFSASNWKLQWSDKSFNQRVKFICEHEPTLEPALVLSQMLTYTDASEMLHGTLWGILLLSGAFNAEYFKNPLNPTAAEVSKFYSQKIAKPLFALSELMLLTVKIVAATNTAKLASQSRISEALLMLLEQQKSVLKTS